MRLVHHELSKPQRALRAYLNLSEPPQGFKGNPWKLEDRKTIERDLDHKNLSYYWYVMTTLCSTAEEEFDMYYYDKPNEKHWYYEPRGPLLPGTIIAASKDEIISDAKNGKTTRSDLAAFADSINKMDDEVLKHVNEIYARAVQMLMPYIVGFALRSFLEGPGKETWILDFRREHGRNAIMFQVLAWLIRGEFEKQDATALSEKERAAYSIALGYFSVVALRCGLDTWKERNEGRIGKLGRPLFSNEDTQAWHFLRGHLFDGSLTKRILFDAVKVEDRHELPDQKYSDKLFKLLKLHKKYGLKCDFSINLCNSQHKFFMEASSFIGKWFEKPVANFEIAVYPYSEYLRRWLSYIANPSFEHADGAIALPSLAIKKGRLILEEIQSDVPDMIGMSNGFRIDDFDAAYSAAEPIAYRWQKIALAAVKEFARRHGFTEFYAATPWRVLLRYRGSMHPDKADNYFGVMEANGGQLVHDYAGELGKPQHYWRFDV